MIGSSACVGRFAVSLARARLKSRFDFSSLLQRRALSTISPSDREKLLKPTILNGFLYRLATPDDREQLRDGLERWFYPEEPLNAAHRDGPQYTQEDMDWMVGLIDHGYVVLALEESDGSLAGSCAGALITPSFVEEVTELAKTAKTRKFKDTCLFLAHCTRNANVFERFQAETAFQVQFTSVLPNYRGRKLGTIMMEKCLEIAQRIGAGVIYGDCTGPFMARSCQSIGMRCVYEIAYRDFRDENGENVFKPLPNYEYLQCHAMKL
ncbi:uncharacterized protein LOC129757235 [Uranotaenia lowii]|uniref:uncharacterized protein LOC129757235 n=1 Tax=Uranotaenia lowii TaxID=190385 RepID=UPI0024797F3F|nr:uncharacterized protein LOC129757235 [Uranotaenia lowii]